MTEKAKRSPSELLKLGYSDHEIQSVYSLGKFYLEVGSYHQAEVIFKGLIGVMPDYEPGLLGLCCINIIHGNLDTAQSQAQQVLRINAESIAAQLLLITVLLSKSDYTAAGTYLGEIGEMLDRGRALSSNLIRYYNAQLLRFEYRQT